MSWRQLNLRAWCVWVAMSTLAAVILCIEMATLIAVLKARHLPDPPNYASRLGNSIWRA
jgi:hypothetical protein